MLYSAKNSQTCDYQGLGVRNMNLPTKSQEPEEQNTLEKLKLDCKTELEQAQKELKEKGLIN